MLNNDFFKDEVNILPKYLLTKYKFQIIDMNSLEAIEKMEKTIVIAEPGKIKFSNLQIIIRFLKTFDSKRISWIYVKENIK